MKYYLKMQQEPRYSVEELEKLLLNMKAYYGDKGMIYLEGRHDVLAFKLFFDFLKDSKRVREILGGD